MPATQPSLYLVGTPIGNLEDISLRALRILKEVDLIACEDTRQTSKLLNHYGITTRTISYHQHNELTRSAELIMHLEQGHSIALVTDAGMPGVSDPGFRLASLAIRHKIPVVPDSRSLGLPQRAGSQRPANGLLCLPRLSALQARPAPQDAGGDSALAAHPDLLRSAAPPDGHTGRHRRRAGPASPCSGGSRGHENLRGICARHRRRGPRQLQEARRRSAAKSPC